LNSEITVSLILKNKKYSETAGDDSLGLMKSDLLMSALLEGKNDKDSTYKPVNTVTATHTKVINCPQREQYCDPVTVAYLSYIPYNQYQLSIQLLNVKQLYAFGMLDDYVEIQVINSLLIYTMLSK
jgi:hypothetical protein